MKKCISTLLGLAVAVSLSGGAWPAVAATVTAYYRTVDGTFANGAVVDPLQKALSVGGSAAFSATAPAGTRAGEWWVYSASPLGSTALSASPERKVGEGASVTYTMQSDDVNGMVVPLVLHLVKTHGITANASPAAGGTAAVTSGMNAVGTVDDGANVTLRAHANGGYTFDHWERNGVRIEGSDTLTAANVREDAAYVAVFAGKEYSLTVYMDEGVRYEGQASPYTLPTKFVYGSANLNGLAVLEKDGFRFQGYYLRSNGAQIYDANGHNVRDTEGYWSASYPHGVYQKEGHLAIEARFAEIVTYDVTVDVSPAAGSVTGGGRHEENSVVSLTAMPNAGYSFACWQKGEQVLTDNPLTFTLTADVAYTAVFTGNVYTVALEGTRETPSPMMRVTYGKPYGEFPTVSDPDFVVEGWYTGSDGAGTLVESSTNVTTAADHALYAKMGPRTEFDVIYVDSRSDLSRNSTFTNSVATNVTSAITREIAGRAAFVDENWTVPDGYTLKGWDPPLPQPVVHGLTLTALWASLADVLDCTNKNSGVAFSVNSQGKWKVQENADGEDPFAAKEGDSCLRLQETDGINTVEATVSKPGELSFHWKASDGNTLRMKVPGKDHVLLTGRNDMDWAKTNIIIETVPISVTFERDAGGTDVDCALDGFALDVFRRNVTVLSGDHGTASRSPEGPLPFGDSVTLTATPADGYAFSCWTNETGFVTNVTPWTFAVEKDLCYTATFTNAQYVVTLDSNGGTGGETAAIVTYDTLVPNLEKARLPTHPGGLKFGGYTNETGTAYYAADGTGLQAWGEPRAGVLSAKWDDPSRYRLTVDVDGRGDVGKSPDLETYAENAEVVVTALPQAGAAFSHWSDGVFDPVRTVAMTTDVGLTAFFTNSQYVVTFNAIGGSVTPTPQLVTYDAAYGDLPELPPTSAPIGYAFDGWHTSAAGGDRIESATRVAIAADHTLYAHWKKGKNAGELAMALDCNRLDFAADGGWAVLTNEDYAKEGDSCLTNAMAGAELSMAVKTSGTLSFWWCGEYGDDSPCTRVFTNGAEVTALRMIVNEDDELAWEEKSLKISASDERPVTLLFKADGRYGGYMALDFFTWTPDEAEPVVTNAVPVAATGLVYDGTEKVGVPAGENYMIFENAATNAGTYEAVALLTNGVWAGGFDGATNIAWTIAKARYDMSGVTFTNETVTYDGEPHSLLVDETKLPEGVTVSYTGNGQTSGGDHAVTATFMGDATNYETIPDMTATLTIVGEPEPVVTNAVPVAVGGLVYDGTAKVGVPAGENYAIVGNAATNAGTYAAVATVTNGVWEGGAAGETNITWTIAKAPAPDVSGVSFADATFEYDGASHSIAVSGTVPAGVEVVYSGDPTSRTDVGTSTVTAGFRVLDEVNYEAIVTTLTAKLVIVKKEEPPVPPEDAPLYEPSQVGTFDPGVAAAYNGWLYKDGQVVATIQAKTTASRRAGTPVKSTVTVTPVGGKKKSYKTEIAVTSDGSFVDGFGIRYGDNALTGDVVGLPGVPVGATAAAAKDFSKSKDLAEKARTSDIPVGCRTLALPTADGYDCFSVTLDKKGKASVKGTLDDGSSVSATAQGALGAKVFAVPVAYSKTLTSKATGVKRLVTFGFLLRIDLEGGAAQISNETGGRWIGGDRLVSQAKAVVPPADGSSHLIRLETPAGYLATSVDGCRLTPDGERIAIDGKKWSADKSVGSVKYDAAAGGVIVKAGKGKTPANVSKFKLTFTPKTGVVKGSFKLYCQPSPTKVKAESVTVTGIVVDGVFYGNAVIKKKGLLAIWWE